MDVPHPPWFPTCWYGVDVAGRGPVGWCGVDVAGRGISRHVIWDVIWVVLSTLWARFVGHFEKYFYLFLQLSHFVI